MCKLGGAKVHWPLASRTAGSVREVAVGMVLVAPADGAEVKSSSERTGVIGITTLATEDNVILQLSQV